MLSDATIVSWLLSGNAMPAGSPLHASGNAVVSAMPSDDPMVSTGIVSVMTSGDSSGSDFFLFLNKHLMPCLNNSRAAFPLWLPFAINSVAAPGVAAKSHTVGPPVDDGWQYITTTWYPWFFCRVNACMKNVANILRYNFHACTGRVQHKSRCTENELISLHEFIAT